MVLVKISVGRKERGVRWFSSDFETRCLCLLVLHEHYGRVVFLFHLNREESLLRLSRRLGCCVHGLLSLKHGYGKSCKRLASVVLL